MAEVISYTKAGIEALIAATLAEFNGATQEDIDVAIAALVDTAPGTLDTLNELASALGDDANFAASISTALAALDTRVDTLEAAPAAEVTQAELDAVIASIPASMGAGLNFVSASSATGDGSNSMFAAMPAGIVAGDRLVGIITHNGGNVNPTIPAGWTLVKRTYNATFDRNVSVVAKDATGSDGANFDISYPSGSRRFGIYLAAYRGPAGPISAMQVSTDVFAGGVAPSAPSAVVGAGSVVLTSFTTVGFAAFPAPTGYTDRGGVGPSAGNFSGNVFEESYSGAGSTGALLSNTTASPDQTFATTVVIPLVDDVTQAELDAVVASLSIIGTNSRPGTAYTLALTDAGLLVESTDGTGFAVTVPPNSTHPFPIGTVIEFSQYGAGQMTFVAGAGVTIRSTDGKLKLYGQYTGASLRKRATNEWILVGDLVA